MTRGEVSVQVAFDRRVLQNIVVELAKSPSVEEGGKYVGYLLPQDMPELRALGLDQARPALIVTDFLPSGPNAVRTAVELQPDGDYQERLFRQLEQQDSAIEHLGSWHSHHCNGLQVLSSGDIDGYHRTVNKRAYRPNYFIASLVTRLPRGTNDAGWIDHFLFVRGEDKYYRITDLIQVVEYPSRYTRLIDHSAQSNGSSERPRAAIPAPAPMEHNQGMWYESSEGRMILAEDKRSFVARFGDAVVATRRGRAITMTGRLGEASVSATYPEDGGAQVVVAVNYAGATILQLTADLRWRDLAFTAAAVAAEHLHSNSAGRPRLQSS